MKKQKMWKLASIVLLAFVFNIFGSPMVSVAYGAPVTEERVIKILSLPCYFTWGQFEDKDANWHWDNGEPGSMANVSDSYDINYITEQLGAKAELVSVEPLNESNFSFASSDEIWYPTPFAQDGKNYFENYNDLTLENYAVTSYSMNDKGIVSYNTTGKLKESRAYNVLTSAYKDSGNKALQDLYPLMGGEDSFKTNFPSLYQKARKHLLTDEVLDQEESKAFVWFNPTVITIKLTPDNDLAITGLNSADQMPANSSSSLVVTAKNNSNTSHQTAITLNFNGQIQTQPITLAGNQTKAVNFNVQTPNKNTTVTATAEINKDRVIEEKDYTNNVKSKNITIKKATAPVADCVEQTTWTEVVVEWVSDGDGSYWPIYHYFTYEATLKMVNFKITDDRKNNQQADWVLNDNGKVQNYIRTGYGIKVYADTNVVVEQTSGPWQRAYTGEVTPANKTAVTTSWVVSDHMHQGQPQTIILNKDGSTNGLRQKFKTPVNSLSKVSADVIYIDLEVQNGLSSMVIRASGSTTPGGKLCKEVTGKINVEGTFYDDYRVN